MPQPTDRSQRASRPHASRAFSRRVVLRGAGCAMALPWLESTHARAETLKASDFPKRFGIVFLEAAATGVPQVAGASGGAGEAVEDGVTGVLVRRPTEAGDVARAIAGKRLDEIEHDVERAEGVDAHVEAHARMVRPGDDAPAHTLEPR